MTRQVKQVQSWVVGVAAALLALASGCESSDSSGGGGGGGGCIANCAGRTCGDDGCGGLCGSCGQGTYCSAGSCVSGDCVPQCLGKSCGDDGCGGLCGSCGQGKNCSFGTCIPSSPSCLDKCSTSTCADSANVAKCAVGPSGCKEIQVLACSGGQICKNGACGQCSSSQDCPEDSVCGAGACKNFSGVKYRFSISALKVPEKDAGGASWDGFGGLPDPFVCLEINGAGKGCTSVKDDTLSATWTTAEFEAVVYSADVIGFSVYDEDLSSDDYMGGVEFGNTSKTLRGGGATTQLFLKGASAQSSSFTVTWSVEAL